MKNLQNLSDKELYTTCKKLGAAALEARRKFAGLLPEVYGRELREREKGRSWLQKRGFSCIYEFAAKLAGMTREQVDLVLRLEKRFEDKPVLRSALVNGEVSANKLARVVSIASVENQQDLLGKVEVLSHRALEAFVKDFKNQNGCGEPKNGQKSLHVQTLKLDEGMFDGVKNAQKSQNEDSLEIDGGMKIVQQSQNSQSLESCLELDEDVKKELVEMKNKGIDVSRVLREFLRERKEKLEQEKSEIAKKQLQKRDDRALIGMPAKRYVPVEVRRIVINEFGTKCSVPGCAKPTENLHHEKSFAKDQCHDPRYLKPMCKGHHELAHAV